MGFIGVCRAIYDYEPVGEGELEITDGDLLFILDKGEDSWWRAKKKAPSEDQDEPEGLIPSNYVEEAEPTGTAKAQFDYERQTDEELSFAADATLQVYDASDPDWILVGAKGEYGFAPANYLEVSPRTTSQRSQEAGNSEPRGPLTPSSSPSPVNAAAQLAGIIHQRTGGPAATSSRRMASPPLDAMSPPSRAQYTPEESEEEQPPPRLPQRRMSEEVSSPKIQRSRAPSFPDTPRQTSRLNNDDEIVHSPRTYKLYNVFEIVKVMGKNQKVKTTLGINVAKGTIMISAHGDSSQQEWTADKLERYNLEGKHVFLDLKQPAKNIDLHAGAKDTAKEIVAYLGELAGAARAESQLQDVLAASARGSGGQKKGRMAYTFTAEGDDEVSVQEGDEVIVLDDTKSDEWWMIRRIKNGKEGVVPSGYVDIVGTVPAAAPRSSSGLNAGRSFVEQNRIEEQRLTKEASKKGNSSNQLSPTTEVGPGLQLPSRHSSLMPTGLPTSDDSQIRSSSRNNRSRSSNHSGGGRSSKSEKTLPKEENTRTWTDRSGSFKVEAEFITLRDEKIHLHKRNGVKIAVPVIKMAMEDLEYVERITGESLDDFKPLADLKSNGSKRAKPTSSVGASLSKKPDYDWFNFFLECGVNLNICERYAQTFARDQMGEESLPEITSPLLRTLGLKEGDILRVMTFLNKKFNRHRQVSFADSAEATNGGSGGIFSGPGGALRDNSRKGRPVPPVETKNEIDPELFSRQNGQRSPTSPTATTERKSASDGFDDDAWAPRASKSNAVSSAPSQSAASSVAAARPGLTPGMAELSLLDTPLQPTIASQPAPQQQTPSASQPQQPTGATPSLFDQLAKGPVGQTTQQAQQQGLHPQQTGYQQEGALNVPRQRPQAPQSMQTGSSLGALPPQRAASVPQNFQNHQSGFAVPPLQAQLTGFQGPLNIQGQVAPLGQSLQELQQQRMPQQQPGFMTNQPTGFGQFPQNQQQSMGYGGLSMPQPGGYLAALRNGAQQNSPFADSASLGSFQPQATGMQQGYIPMQTQQPIYNQPQPTGFQPNFGFNQFQQNGMSRQNGMIQPQATGVNSFLPPALVPQATGISAGQFGNSSYGGFNQAPPPVPPIPQQLQPLLPQKTGPPPPVRFGTQAANRLVSQPTGRRANLSQATPQNPFGF